MCSANSAAVDVGTITFCPRHILEYGMAWCKIADICVLRENTLLTRRNGKKLQSSAHSGFDAGQLLTDLMAPQNWAARAAPH